MKKQPAHGCMPADRIICRTWEHTNRALIFQSVPGCPKCPTVPAFRGRDSGTTVENQTSKKVMSNYSLQKYKGTSQGIPVRIAGTDVPLPTMWTKAVRPFTRQSADATTKAVAGIIIRPDSIFTTTPNAGPPVISLPADNVWRRSPSNRCNRQPSVTYRRTMWRNRRACIATSAVSFQYCLIPITAARQRKCWNG